MDPASLSILMKSLIPIVSILAVFGVPVGIVWTLQHHKYKMRELDLESQGGSQRLQTIKARLAALEAALGVQAPLGASVAQRAALLEPPPKPSEVSTNPELPRLRQR
jgi:hypothetical protein